MNERHYRHPTILRTMLLIVLITFAAACEQTSDLHLDFTTKNPPSFSFSGKSAGVFFEVMEVPQTKPLSKTNPFARDGKTIWKIAASNKLPADNWPKFTYGGDIPTGFSQVTPGQGPPPKLIEHKLYLARIVGEEDAENGFYFEVRRDRIVNVTHKLFGQ